MSISTNAELKAALASWGKRSDLTDLMADFIAYAHQEINRTLRANVLITTADVVVSAETVAQPTGFLALKRLYLDLTPRRELGVTSVSGAQDMCVAYATTTYPSHVAVEGANLRFAPLFTGTATGKLLYYKSATVLSAAGDTNVVLTKYPYMYLNGALSELFRYIEDDNLADRYEARFRALIEAVNQSEAKDIMSGPLQAAPSRGSVV